MALRVLIVGPGRVGSACGRRLAEAGVAVLGFVGRDAARAAAAVRFAGAGEVLGPGDHPRAHAVLFAVGDGELQAAIAELKAAAPPRPCSLWLHTSGVHGLEVFDEVAGLGARRGALHPVVPFADAETGSRRMVGQPAVVIGDHGSMRLLQQIARRLGMVPVPAAGQRRELYHAACALAANGLVALRALVDEALAASGGLSTEDGCRVVDALMASTLAGLVEAETEPAAAAAALSGPVLRGDAATVTAHLAALSAHAPRAVSAYRALMQVAVDLAVRRGLPPERAAVLRALLAEEASEP